MRVFGALRSTTFALSAMAILLVAGCADTSSDEQVGVESQATTAAGNAAAIDIKRSLAIIDLPTLAATGENGVGLFSLKRVLNVMVATSGAPSVGGAAELYQRIFDTNNTRAASFVPDGQHCDDQKNATGAPVLNGFPIQCPRQEGVLANLSQHDPFCTGPGCDPYSPIAITNRFDLAPPTGETCGQYRIVFGKGTGGQAPVPLAGNKEAFDRNLIIFEAVLPNPQPQRGLAACAPVVQFWAGLSAIDSPALRAAELNRFFFQGLPGFEAGLKFSHFTGAVHPQSGVQLSGQIRANQFMLAVGFQGWQLREYNVERACPGGNRPCVSKVKMVTTKANPSGSLFEDGNTTPVALAFRNPSTPGGFISQIPQLALGDVNQINMNGLGPQFNGAQSTSSPALNFPLASNDTNYNPLFKPGGAFAAAIQTRLDSLGSTLTPTEIVRRAQTQACAGCHELSTSTAFAPPPFGFGGSVGAAQLGGGLVWPDAAQSGPQTGSIVSFTQTSEVNLQPIDPASGVTCDTTCTADPLTCQCEWVISAALTDVFLPFRRDNMASFLAGLP
jgi:hypothetical protein